MKYLLPVIILACMLTSCGEDQEPFQEISDEPLKAGFRVENGFIQYDGDNHAAPEFKAGESQVAVKFPTPLLNSVQGKAIEGLSYYIWDLPDSASASLFQGSLNGGPGELLITRDISGDLSGMDWNTLDFNEQLVIDANMDLWVTLTFYHSVDAGIIGCDKGPQIANGALQLNQEWGSWDPFFVDVNWNIRIKYEN